MSHTACRQAWACVVIFHHHHIKIEDPVITAARAAVWLKELGALQSASLYSLVKIEKEREIW